jgi:squalene-hopene/tetraprenyl-beta-curcumene cyclase
MIHRTFGLPAFLVLSFVSFSGSLANPAPPKSPRQGPDVKSEIDRSIHWLRESQDVSTGAYGGSVGATAWALRAFHDCPRHYRLADGPFVSKAVDWMLARQRKDGAIASEKSEGKAAAEETALAVMALKLYAEESSKDALAKALAFVGKQEGLAAPDASLSIPADAGAAKAATAKILATRGADGAWDGEHGKITETARNLVILSAAVKLAAPTPPPAGTGAGAAEGAPNSASAPPKALPRFEEVDRQKTLQSLARGGAFLMSKCKDGRFEGRPGKPDAGITALAIGALECLPEPRPKETQEAIEKGLAWIVSLQKKDGAIHDGELANYVTSASILALARAKKPELKPVIEKARDFLIALQADEAEGYSPDHPFYGGNSYGDDERPDLSNVQMALEALAASGLEKGNPAYKRALVFLSRCQNRSESNSMKVDTEAGVIVAGNDGGGVYAPGNSKAGTIDLPDGRKVARSYGSMSYALLKSFIFAGLPKDDPRMKACWEWLRKNYTLDVNPGFETSKDPNASYQGLFYYFHTMAKALDLYGEEAIVDPQGKSHAWRKELCGRIAGMQSKEDGSWKNENSPRWWEGNPILATSYAMVSLDAAMPR